jgi:hypothetical protein
MRKKDNKRGSSDFAISSIIEAAIRQFKCLTEPLDDRDLVWRRTDAVG